MNLYLIEEDLFAGNTIMGCQLPTLYCPPAGRLWVNGIWLLQQCSVRARLLFRHIVSHPENTLFAA